MQKQLDEASKQSQKEMKSLSEETTMMRREVDDSNMFLKSMADWRTSEQYDEIRELKTKNIALQCSLNNTQKSLDRVTLRVDLCESQQEAVVLYRKPLILKTRNLPSARCDELSRVL